MREEKSTRTLGGVTGTTSSMDKYFEEPKTDFVITPTFRMGEKAFRLSPQPTPSKHNNKKTHTRKKNGERTHRKK